MSADNIRLRRTRTHEYDGIGRKAVVEKGIKVVEG